MDAGFVKVLVTPNVQAIPVALAAQSASLLACSADELQRAIRELTLTNPMVEPAEGDDPYYDLISSIPARRETLAEHLSAQLRMTLKDPALLRVCLLLANSLDANGYLRDDEVGLCRDFSCDAALFHRALRHIQALEPAGVGARSLSECLCLQLQAMGDPDPLAALIAREHLEALARGTLSLPGVSVATTDAAVALLLSLEPRPGSAFDHEATVFVVPDVAVHLQDGALAVSLVNQPHIPALNAPYTALMAQVSPQDRQYLQEQLAYARSFLYAVQQRSSTLLCVAAYAVQQQAAHLMEPQHCPLRRGKVDEDRRTIAVGDDLLDAHHRAAVPLHNVHRDRRSREQLFLLRRCSKVLRQPLIQSKRRCSCRHAAQDRDDRRKHRRRAQAASSFCLVRHVHYLRNCVFGGVKRGDRLLI